MTDIGQCDCCGDEPAVGVAAIPFIPMSISWGHKCLTAGIIPYWAAVANTACCGGYDQTNEMWRELVADTLAYFDKTMEEFLADVERDGAEMDQAVGEMARGEDEQL
jgi:hypothetical protein